MNASSAPSKAEAPRLTDSPWFWVYLFSTGGFIMLMLMSTKYEHRQTHIEDEYRYGTRTLQRPAGATLPNDSAPSASEQKAEQAADAHDRTPLATGPQPPTHEMLISLEPLRVLTGIVMVVSCIALQVSYLRRRAKAKALA